MPTREARNRLFIRRLFIYLLVMTPLHRGSCFRTRIRKTGSTPALPKHPGHLNDNRWNSSSTEAGVLVAYPQATVRSLPKEARTITGGGTQSPTITMPTLEPAYSSTYS
ncbi:hypothetical protein AVEN_64043-1 [Araneus ventricosus]|uniref:Secreted protein n=1 Tax=Araneus ventricosus TaxID=182803 RepID=A0A4Y2GHU3_ARAVE|nr:hypothetical protein AVEN_64043-1 [Araneus ventricosus]